MNCEKWMQYQAGPLTPQQQQAFKQHLAACPACRANAAIMHALPQALAAPAAPAALVEKVFARTTRRVSWWVRYRLALAGGVAALLLALGAVHYLSAPRVPSLELIAYASEINQSEYTVFSGDLDLFEQEF